MRYTTMVGAFGFLFATAQVQGQDRVAPTQVTLARDTPVVLMATSEVRSDHVAPGTVFKLRVDRPVTIAAGVVIPVGTPAYGEVVAATGSQMLGTNGTMDVRLRYIQLGDVRIPIEGTQSAKGAGAGSAQMVVLFSGVIGLFHHGNNAKIKAGELLGGFLAEDVTLDLAATPVRRMGAP